MANYTRYNREELEIVVGECLSYAEVARRLGKKPVGGTITNLNRMCRRFGIDTSHMTGARHNKGKRSFNRALPEKLLVMGTPLDHRVGAGRLRKVLFELGVEYKCVECGIDTWNDKLITLEIDHIDGQYWNNQRDNLQFLCPNCHSQK